MPVYHGVQDEQQLPINAQSCQRLTLSHAGHLSLRPQAQCVKHVTWSMHGRLALRPE